MPLYNMDPSILILNVNGAYNPVLIGRYLFPGMMVQQKKMPKEITANSCCSFWLLL